MKEGTHKLLIETDAQDTLILTRLAELLEVPKSVICRWALRYYALHAPQVVNTEAGKAFVLAGITELNTGLGIREKTGCEVDESSPAPNKKRPKNPNRKPPARRGRKSRSPITDSGIPPLKLPTDKSSTTEEERS